MTAEDDMIVAAMLMLLTQAGPPNVPDLTPPDFVASRVSWERQPRPLPPYGFRGYGQVGLDCAAMDRRLTDCHLVYAAGEPGLERAVLASIRQSRLALGDWPERVKFTVRVYVGS